MKSIIFALPGNETLTDLLAQKLTIEKGQLTLREFPDGETYVRLQSPVKRKKVILVCTLDRPDDKFLPLYYIAKTARVQGAKHICLVAPYLAYMRQDKIFQPGEGLTSRYFAALVSDFVDSLITVDPHLHRISRLDEIYTIPTEVVRAARHISNWIGLTFKNPVLVGPDSESEQWVAEVAKNADAPFIILEKTRRGDREVEVSVPEVAQYINHTPILVDDIISTARTMIQTVGHLKNAGMKPPICVGVHGIFAGEAYADLLAAGAAKVVTCNTILHKSNGIEISDLFLDFLKKVVKNKPNGKGI